MSEWFPLLVGVAGFVTIGVFAFKILRAAWSPAPAYHCPTCGYDLTGGGDVCSECGAEVPPDVELAAARRIGQVPEWLLEPAGSPEAADGEVPAHVAVNTLPGNRRQMADAFYQPHDAKGNLEVDGDPVQLGQTTSLRLGQVLCHLLARGGVRCVLEPDKFAERDDPSLLTPESQVWPVAPLADVLVARELLAWIEAADADADDALAPLIAAAEIELEADHAGS